MRYLVSAALLALVVGVSTALAGSAGGAGSSQGKHSSGIRNGVIHACYESHGTQPSVGDIKFTHCKGFKPLVWNIRGPKGAMGPKGDSGTNGTNGAAGPKGDTGAPGAKGDTGPPGPPGTPAPTPEYGIASVFVDRGSGPTRYATVSATLGSPAGTTGSGTFRFSCPAAQAPCKISYGAAIISTTSTTNAAVHPRLLIQKQDNPSSPTVPMTFCEYADGANNNAGLDVIPRVPTLAAAVTAMQKPLDMGIGSTLDCGSTQTWSDPVTEIWVPASLNQPGQPAYYDVEATFAFSPTLSLPPGP